MARHARGALGAVMALAATPSTAQDAPRIAWGEPDLQGVWDFRTITPLQRPEALGDQAFLMAEEAANLEQEAVARDQRLLEAAPTKTEAGGNVAGYNKTWMDRGTRTIETRRTSLVIVPSQRSYSAHVGRGKRPR